MNWKNKIKTMVIAGATILATSCGFGGSKKMKPVEEQKDEIENLYTVDVKEYENGQVIYTNRLKSNSDNENADELHHEDSADVSKENIKSEGHGVFSKKQEEELRRIYIEPQLQKLRKLIEEKERDEQGKSSVEPDKDLRKTDIESDSKPIQSRLADKDSIRDR